MKGLEPHLYECLAASFQQNYPSDKLSIRLCVEDKTDPAYPTLKKIVEDFPDLDAQVLIEAEDPVLNGSSGIVDNLGPNPKIRNVSRAYREAKGDIIWVMDCNVWIARDVMGRMVDKMMGYAVGGGSNRPYKFVHQLPIVVDTVDYSSSLSLEGQSLLASTTEAGPHSEPTPLRNPDLLTKIRSQGGGRLDELFFGTSHAKFYSAINTLGVAPCVVGKSNMFRKSQLDKATNPDLNPQVPREQNRPLGIDYFSHQICEDHLIGELLWGFKIPGYSKHGLVWGDLAIQAMTGMSVSAYAARRARWLRARKLTVPAATLVEPGVESFLCCLYFAFAATTLPFFKDMLGVPPTWGAMALIWLATVTIWMIADWFLTCRLQSGITVKIDEQTPVFAKGQAVQGGIPQRPFLEWFPAWLGREALALPVWVWAVLLGRTVTWRGKSFRVRYDTTVYEVTNERRERSVRTPEVERAASQNKRRVD